jgi:hypothetical protein
MVVAYGDDQVMDPDPLVRFLAARSQLLGYIGMLLPADLVEDCFQDCFLVVQRQAGRFDPQRDFSLLAARHRPPGGQVPAAPAPPPSGPAQRGGPGRHRGRLRAGRRRRGLRRSAGPAIGDAAIQVEGDPSVFGRVYLASGGHGIWMGQIATPTNQAPNISVIGAGPTLALP